jgi:hypothetical protein
MHAAPRWLALDRDIGDLERQIYRSIRVEKFSSSYRLYGGTVVFLPVQAALADRSRQ